MSDTTIARDLVTEGIAAARAGDSEQAARLLRRATELDPTNVEAWLWRSSLTDTLADKKAFLAQVLELDPNNLEARKALEKVIEREGALAERAGDEVLYCTVHPDRETMLRCNRCGRPMCPDCAVRTPVGLRCRECVTEQRSPIYQIGASTATVALILGAILGAIGSLIVPMFGFWVIFVGPIAGELVTRVVEAATPRKRGRTLALAASAGVVLGYLGVVATFLVLSGRLVFLFNPWAWIFVGLTVMTLFARLR
ncbi:MAG TPA: hypothetical protein DEP84_01610 [Chloroflexi bacterium]|nr:hypothetical protein [Chloroflexota bacterium]